MNPEIITIDLGAVNCYLIKAENGFVLVDTGGCTIFDVDQQTIRNNLEKALENAGCTPGTLKLIVLTHGDLDHCGNCAYLRDKYGAKIAIHHADSYLVEQGVLVKGVKFKPYIFKIIMNVFFRSQLKKFVALFEKFVPDFFIDEDFDLSAYGLDAKILHLPGHTPGSIGVLTSDGSIICGDILTYAKKPSYAPNACDFNQLYASVQRLKALNVQTVYPGHGKPFPMSSFML